MRAFVGVKGSVTLPPLFGELIALAALNRGAAAARIEPRVGIARGIDGDPAPRLGQRDAIGERARHLGAVPGEPPRGVGAGHHENTLPVRAIAPARAMLPARTIASNALFSTQLPE